MTVAELIAELQKLPADMPVVVFAGSYLSPVGAVVLETEERDLDTESGLNRVEVEVAYIQRQF